MTSELELEGTMGKRRCTCKETDNLGRAWCILGIASTSVYHYIGLYEGSEEWRSERLVEKITQDVYTKLGFKTYPILGSAPR